MRQNYKYFVYIFSDVTLFYQTSTASTDMVKRTRNKTTFLYPHDHDHDHTPDDDTEISGVDCSQSVCDDVFRIATKIIIIMETQNKSKKVKRRAVFIACNATNARSLLKKK